MSRFHFAARVHSIGVAIFAVIFTGVADGQRLHPANRADRDQSVGFDVFLPLQNQAELDQLLIAQQTVGSPSYHKWLTPQEFRARFGAKPEDLAKVSRALQSYGMRITRTHSQGVHVQAQAIAIETAFGAALWTAKTSHNRQKLITTEPLTLPAALKETGAQIMHFSPMIAHRVHSKAMDAIPENRNSPFGRYWFTDLKQAYQFPSSEYLTGKGTTIAVVISSDINDNDIALYFAHEGLKPPSITRRPVEGGAPFDPTSGDSFEAELDIQQSGGMAPGATLILYNIPDLGDDSVIAGYVDVLEDNAADIVNSSFGAPEVAYTAPYNGDVDYTGIFRVYEALFKQGNAQGITFVASSGDNGALAVPPPSYFTMRPQNPPVVVGNFQVSVEHPASSPNVTGVGGTNPLQTTYSPPTLDSAYVGEQAYGDPLIPYDPYGTGNLVAGGYWGSGGGISIAFSQPVYQQLVNTNSEMRTVPDVSLFMGGCPSGISVPGSCNPNDGAVVEVFNGRLYGVIGTSASAPGFAGLLALEEEHLGGRLGNVNYLIYAQAAQQSAGSWFPFFHQNIAGYNGLYNSGAAYNYVVGNGTPIGTSFIFAPNITPAGTPQTPSNP